MLAIALGGIVLCYRAMDSLARGLLNLGDAAISWKRVSNTPDVLGLVIMMPAIRPW